MIHRFRHAAVAAVLLTLATGLCTAQVLDHPTLYRLERGSTFQRGCFPPCKCPVMEAVPITGTFRLELVTVGDVFDFYEVTAVRWKVRRNSGDLLITGSGTYKVSTIADLQEMNLTLVVGAEQPTVYQSDSVPGGASFPRIALPISINGGYCFDTVIDLRARPASRLRVYSSGIGWDPETEVADARYDVVQGDLQTLLETGGAFDVATWACLANRVSATWLPFGASPESGRGYWFLERSDGGSYADADAAQVGSPDEQIAASVGACP